MKSVMIFLCLIAIAVMSYGQDSINIVRNQKWREDISYLKLRFPAYDKSISPFLFFNTYSKTLEAFTVKDVTEHFYELADSIYNKVNEMGDEQIMLALSRLIALSPNAHSRLYLFRVRTVLNNIPVGIYWFGEELRIVSCPKDQPGILGARILEINGEPIKSMKRKISALIPGNASWKCYMSTYFLRSPQVLKGLGLTSDGRRMQLKVMTIKNAILSTTLEASFISQTKTQEAWKDLSPIKINHDSLQHLLKENDKLPFYLQHPDRSFAYSILKKEGILLLQINRNEAGSELLSFNQFMVPIITIAKQQQVKKIVLDLRFNTGGDFSTTVGSITNLCKAIAGKKAYIIVSKATFSAGIMSAALFKKLTHAKVVGEAPGDELVFLSEGGNLLLPNSRLNVHYANGLQNWQFSESFTLSPDIYVPFSFNAYLNEMDMALESIIKDR